MAVGYLFECVYLLLCANGFHSPFWSALVDSFIPRRQLQSCPASERVFGEAGLHIQPALVLPGWLGLGWGHLRAVSLLRSLLVLS